MENIAETEASIEAILRKKHDGLLEEIQQEADALGPGCEYGITDDFSDRIIYERHWSFPSSAPHRKITVRSTLRNMTGEGRIAYHENIVQKLP